MTESHFMTIAEASAAIHTRSLSPVELTQSFLNRIKALDGQLDSYLMVLEETALAAAKQAEQEIAAGRWKGPLHGTPIGLKDIYNTAGVRTTGHSALFKDHIPTEDAATVMLLREAGAIVLGKFATWEFEDVVAVNLRAPFFACQAALPAMKAQGKGRIVNVGSQLGSVATVEHALYGMTKTALIYLTKAIALESAASGITVNCVSPGATETAYMITRLAGQSATRDAMLGHIPLGRFSRPAEVAEAGVFLATCEGDAIQGHDLLVDGGWITH